MIVFGLGVLVGLYVAWFMITRPPNWIAKLNHQIIHWATNK